jgi:hypothetical protein
VVPLIPDPPLLLEFIPLPLPAPLPVVELGAPELEPDFGGDAAAAPEFDAAAWALLVLAGGPLKPVVLDGVEPQATRVITIATFVVFESDDMRHLQNVDRRSS